MDGISVLWCLRRVNANGKRNEFRAYCDQALIPTWCESYNKEAKQLVETNSWSKAVIENGTHY